METRDRPSSSAGWLVILCLLLTVPLTAQDFTVRPSIVVPVADSARWFETGVGLGAEWSARPPSTAWRLGIAVDALDLPDKARGSLLFLALHPSVGYAFLETPGLVWSFDLDLGYSLVARANFVQADACPWATAGTSVRWSLEKTLAFRAAVQYQTAIGLYQGVGAWAGFELTGG